MRVEDVPGPAKMQRLFPIEKISDTFVEVAAKLTAHNRSQQIISASAYLRNSILPLTDKLDPFAVLPVNLTRFQEHLVRFYLYQYPNATYGFSTKLQPHPTAINFVNVYRCSSRVSKVLARTAISGTILTFLAFFSGSITCYELRGGVAGCRQFRKVASRAAASNLSPVPPSIYLALPIRCQHSLSST